MYWAELNGPRIQRANLDGSNIEDLVTTGLVIPQGVTLDIAARKLYWTDVGTGKIQRSTLDGADIEDLVTEGGNPVNIVLDLPARKMYWTIDSGSDKEVGDS